LLLFKALILIFWRNMSLMSLLLRIKRECYICLQTVEISRKYTELHAAYAETIYDAMKASVKDGSPVNGPLWWLDPTDKEALVIWDRK
jgi:alpha-glucosidase (family GH31 glycosyl hydrolase)